VTRGRSMSLFNVSLAVSHVLQPPGFGFEVLFHQHAADRPVAGTHLQQVLRIRGSAVKPFSSYQLKVDALVRGALWRTQTSSLCTSLDPDPESEHRRCVRGTGEFSASIWSFLPSNRPGAQLHETQASQLLAGDDLISQDERRVLRAPDATHAQRLRIATAALSRINVCTLPSLRPELVGPVCGTGMNATEHTKKVKELRPASQFDVRRGKMRPPPRNATSISPDQLMSASNAWHSIAHSDLFAHDWRTLGAMFVLAVLTLPQPFAIVESGNFCGGLTGYFALLKALLCPSCPYVSLDPGGYRKKRHTKFTCHRASLEWIGLSEHVTFVDEPSPALSLEQPVGFIYYDGGKIRFCNSPLQTYLEDKFMVSLRAQCLAFDLPRPKPCLGFSELKALPLILRSTSLGAWIARWIECMDLL